MLVGTIALTRLLGPRDFGVFAIVRYALELLVLFGDTGLAGALVRQKEEPSERQLSTAFHFQLAVSGLLMTAVIALSPLLVRVWPDLPANAPLLLRVVALDFVFVCARIPPLLLMERRFEFGRMAIVDVVGSITFHGVAIALAAALGRPFHVNARSKRLGDPSPQREERPPRRMQRDQHRAGTGDAGRERQVQPPLTGRAREGKRQGDKCGLLDPGDPPLADEVPVRVREHEGIAAAGDEELLDRLVVGGLGVDGGRRARTSAPPRRGSAPRTGLTWS